MYPGAKLCGFTVATGVKMYGAIDRVLCVCTGYTIDIPSQSSTPASSHLMLYADCSFGSLAVLLYRQRRLSSRLYTRYEIPIVSRHFPSFLDPRGSAKALANSNSEWILCGCARLLAIGCVRYFNPLARILRYPLAREGMIYTKR